MVSSRIRQMLCLQLKSKKGTQNFGILWDRDGATTIGPGLRSLHQIEVQNTAPLVQHTASDIFLYALSLQMRM